MKTVLLVTLIALIASTEGHDWSFGSCPYMKSMDNLAVDKFLGPWYVIEQFDTSSLCLTLNYTRVSESELRVTKLRQFSALDRVGIDHTNSYTGDLDLPHEKDLARMRVKWPLNIAGKGDYIVFDTDYKNYAGIYECQTVSPLFHRKSASILSREPTLAPEYVDRVKRLLTSFKIDTRKFDRISHQGCRNRADADVNLHVDGDTLTSVVSGAREGIEGAATSIMNGIRDLASSVSSATQNTLNSLQRGNSDSTTTKPGEGEFLKPVKETAIEVETQGSAVESAGDAIDSTTTAVTETQTNVGNVGVASGGPMNKLPEGGVPLPDENINSVDTDDSLQENFYTVKNAQALPEGEVIDAIVRIA